MTFLAAMASGGVAMLIGSASEWRSEIAREMTIQVITAATSRHVVLHTLCRLG